MPVDDLLRLCHDYPGATISQDGAYPGASTSAAAWRSLNPRARARARRRRGRRAWLAQIGGVPARAPRAPAVGAVGVRERGARSVVSGHRALGPRALPGGGALRPGARHPPPAAPHVRVRPRGSSAEPRRQPPPAPDKALSLFFCNISLFSRISIYLTELLFNQFAKTTFSDRLPF